MKDKKYAVYAGRLSPMHLGHQFVIDTMISDFELHNCLLILGSATTPQSIRNLFSYSDRKAFVRSIYPSLQIAPLSDYPTDVQWLEAQADLLNIAGMDVDSTLFYGGCEEDLIWYRKVGYTCKIVDRVGGKSPEISATKLREHLLSQRPWDFKKFLDDRLTIPVIQKFNERWDEFCKK
jgi:hypothetical protein